MVLTKTLLACAVILFFNIVASTHGFSEPENSYTCVIGGGYSGLAIARYFKEFGLNFTVLERSVDIGGNWRFDPHVRVDEYGVPVSTSQYQNLRTNSPRYTMEYAGFPFPKHTKSYLTGTFFYKYMKSFVKHFNLMTNIQLRSNVESVKRKNNVWELSYQQTDSRNKYTVLCDFVVVATGQHNKPYSAKLAGLSNFKGKIIHSHDYKTADLYKDRKVLIVGGGVSGLDIAFQLHKIAKKLVHSHHLVYNAPKFSKRYMKKPDIKELVYNGAIFDDSSFEEVEDIILATGYRMDFPFLDESSGLLLTDLFVLPLHNQIVNIRQPSMMFVGISKQTINRVMDAQAEYISLLISGKFELPSQEIMVERWVTKYSSRKLKDVHVIVTEVKEYFQILTKEAGVSTVPPVLVDVVFDSIKNLKHDLFHYREYEFDIIDSQRFTSRLLHNITKENKEKCPIVDL